MTHSDIRLSLAWIVLFAPFLLHVAVAQDEVRPLRVVRVEHAESQVDESDPSAVLWILLHFKGLKVVPLDSDSNVDVLTIPEGISTAHSASRWITPDGKCFAYGSRNRQTITIAPVGARPNLQTNRNVGKPSSILAKLESRELLTNAVWEPDLFLSQDATYVLTLVHQKKQHRVIRIDLLPAPRITASHELGELACNMTATDGIAMVVDSDDTKPRDARLLRVFDHRLVPRHQEKMNGSMFIMAARETPNPWIAIRSSAGEPGSRVKGQPFWQVAKLAQSQSDANNKNESGSRIRFGAKHWIMAAAFSPDAKWLVTSRVDVRTVLGIWSTAAGQLIREVHVEGGKHEMQSDQVITRLAFSKSGRYLCASDASNAYLLDFSTMTKSNSETTSAR